MRRTAVGASELQKGQLERHPNAKARSALPRRGPLLALSRSEHLLGSCSHHGIKMESAPRPSTAARRRPSLGEGQEKPASPARRPSTAARRRPSLGEGQEPPKPASPARRPSTAARRRPSLTGDGHHHHSEHSRTDDKNSANDQILPEIEQPGGSKSFARSNSHVHLDDLAHTFTGISAPIAPRKKTDLNLIVVR